MNYNEPITCRTCEQGNLYVVCLARWGRRSRVFGIALISIAIILSSLSAIGASALHFFKVPLMVIRTENWIELIQEAGYPQEFIEHARTSIDTSFEWREGIHPTLVANYNEDRLRFGIELTRFDREFTGHKSTCLSVIGFSILATSVGFVLAGRRQVLQCSSCKAITNTE